MLFSKPSMGQNHNGRQRPCLLSWWQLGLYISCVVVASKAPFDAHSGVVDRWGKAPANTLTVDLHHTAVLFDSTNDQCPKPGPCHRDQGAESEFCVFATSDAKDDQGISKVVPMVTTPERASMLMQVFSDANINHKNKQRGGGSSNSKYTVKPIPGKGLGVVANDALERGDHILSDLPTLIIDHCMMSTVPQYHLAKLMNEAARRLSPVQLGRLMNLDVFGEAAPDEHYLVGRIYATSAYMLDPDGVLFGRGCGLGALFPEISRMNHDCRPNAAYHFDRDTAMMEVHAVRPITAGEEITVSYISPLISHAHRQHLLHDRWGFKCSCAACSAPATEVNASDTRLEKIFSLWPFLLDNKGEGVQGANGTVTGDRSELAELLVSLAEVERLDAVMLQPYRAAALEWNALGQLSKAKHYAALAVEYGINSFGPRNPMVRDMQDLLQDPELHWSWKLR